jgi:lipopolysaccharide/colanic/teichoic acid biosynthesis glycosyltransferase
MIVSKSIVSSFSIFARRHSLELGNSELTHFEQRLLEFFSYEHIKRATDIFVAVFMLVLLSPLILIIAILICISSSGPVIFKQKRLTQGGHIFTMYKFRTMQENAELNTGPVWTEIHDPRITFIGKILRFFRLDELPQLINVLLGDMSLIGPRPERPEFAEKLEEEIPLFRRRVEVKAGITGLAQIATGYAASIGSYRTKIAFDIEYIENRSFMLDAMIAWRTIKVILTGSGAR